MKNKKLIPLAILMLVSCGGGNSTISESVSKDNSSVISSETSSNIIDSSLQENVFDERADYSSLPYLEKLSDLKKEKQEWHNAKWIWYSKNPADSYFAFRKKFNLDETPCKAILSLSADSKATIFVNG